MSCLLVVLDRSHRETRLNCYSVLLKKHRDCSNCTRSSQRMKTVVRFYSKYKIEDKIMTYNLSKFRFPLRRPGHFKGLRIGIKPFPSTLLSTLPHHHLHHHASLYSSRRCRRHQALRLCRPPLQAHPSRYVYSLAIELIHARVRQHFARANLRIFPWIPIDSAVHMCFSNHSSMVYFCSLFFTSSSSLQLSPMPMRYAFILSP